MSANFRLPLNEGILPQAVRQHKIIMLAHTYKLKARDTTTIKVSLRGIKTRQSFAVFFIFKADGIAALSIMNVIVARLPV